MKPSAVKSTLLRLIPAGGSALLVGSPGVGKTDSVKAVADELGYDLLITHPVVDDPTDYKGLPAIIQGTKGQAAGAEFLPFGNLNHMINAERETIVFFDDLGQAAPAVQAACMQLLLAREINGKRISDKVHFLAATNRRQDKAAVTGLITPLLDRFDTVLPFEFDLDDWVEWVLQRDLPPVLAAFARFKPDLLNKFEANRDMKKSPTPRSAAAVGRLVNLGLDSLDVLSGAAGEGFATEFLAFYRVWQSLPDRNEIYLNPNKAPVPQGKPDVMFALMGSLAHGANAQTIDATVKYLSRVPAEFQALCMKDAIARDRTLVATKAFTGWAVKNQAVFGYDSKAA